MVATGCLATAAAGAQGADDAVTRLLGVTYAEAGRASFVRLAGDSKVAGSVVVEALYL